MDQQTNSNDHKLTSQFGRVSMDSWTSESDEDNDLISGPSQNNQQTTFDLAFGALEEIAIKPSFQSLFNAFLDSNYTKFTKSCGDSNEINQEHFDIFQHYSNTIGNYLENELKKRVDNFDMEEFITELCSRPELMENEVIEMIYSLMDFTKFNELIVDYSAAKEDHGKLGKMIEAGMTVRQIHKPD